MLMFMNKLIVMQEYFHSTSTTQLALMYAFHELLDVWWLWSTSIHSNMKISVSSLSRDHHCYENKSVSIHFCWIYQTSSLQQVVYSKLCTPLTLASITSTSCVTKLQTSITLASMKVRTVYRMTNGICTQQGTISMNRQAGIFSIFWHSIHYKTWWHFIPLGKLHEVHVVSSKQ